MQKMRQSDLLKIDGPGEKLGLAAGPAQQDAPRPSQRDTDPVKQK